MDLVATNLAACLGKMLYRSLGTGMIRLHCRMMTKPVLLWLRQDLRLSDQAALVAAVQAGPVIPLYILDDDTPRHWAMGGAARWWLHHSLSRLDESLRAKGSRLILRQGKSADIIRQVAKQAGADSVYALHHYEPWWRNAEKAVGRQVDLHLHDGGRHVRTPVNVVARPRPSPAR